MQATIRCAGLDVQICQDMTSSVVKNSSFVVMSGERWRRIRGQDREPQSQWLPQSATAVLSRLWWRSRVPPHARPVDDLDNSRRRHVRHPQQGASRCGFALFSLFAGGLESTGEGAHSVRDDPTALGSMITAAAGDASSGQPQASLGIIAALVLLLFS